MNDEKLEEYLRVVEPNFNSHIEKGTIEMSNEYYNMLEERMVRLINKINNLQSKIDKINQHLEERFIFDDENGEYYQTHTFDRDNAKELHDILKEVIKNGN